MDLGFFKKRKLRKRKEDSFRELRKIENLHKRLESLYNEASNLIVTKPKAQFKRSEFNLLRKMDEHLINSAKECLSKLKKIELLEQLTFKETYNAIDSGYQQLFGKKDFDNFRQAEKFRKDTRIQQMIATQTLTIHKLFHRGTALFKKRVTAINVATKTYFDTEKLVWGHNMAVADFSDSIKHTQSTIKSIIHELKDVLEN